MSRKQVGVVSVDSGGIVIVDPCYLNELSIKGGKVKNLVFWGRDKEEAKTELENKMPRLAIMKHRSSYCIKDVRSGDYPLILNVLDNFMVVHTLETGTFSERAFNARDNDDFAGEFFAIGLGTAVSSDSGYGDGSYPVYATYNEDGRISKIEIIFID